MSSLATNSPRPIARAVLLLCLLALFAGGPPTIEAGTLVEWTVAYSYDPWTGRRSGVQFPNGASVEYLYDAFGRIISITHKAAGGATLLNLVYTRDLNGLIVSIAEERLDRAAVTWTYVYDASSRLIRAVREETEGARLTFAYSYDAAGNRTEKGVQIGSETPTTATYTYNSLGQMVSGAECAYEYDVYGNLRRKRQQVEDGLRIVAECQWTSGNCLAEAKLFDPNSGRILKTLAFDYDDQNLLIRRSLTDHVVPGNTKTTRYLVDGRGPTGRPQIAAELDASGTKVLARFFYGDGVLAQWDADLGLAFFHLDHLGSPRLLTDSEGTAVPGSEFDFTPYGEPIGDHGSLTRLRFTGQWYDPDLGLQYHRTRWLDTKAAIWLSADPEFDFPGNFGNAYAYAGLNPITTTDLSGRNGDFLSLVTATGIQMQIAAIRLAPVAPVIGDILLGFLVDDPTLSLTPVGRSVGAGKRKAVELAMDTMIRRNRGWRLVAGQNRPNGPGIDAIYSKIVAGGQEAYMIVEMKVSGVSRYFQALLGRPSYGAQSGRLWSVHNLERLRTNGERIAPGRENLHGIRGLWTSMSDDEIRYIEENIANDGIVCKRVLGALIVQDDFESGGPVVAEVYDYGVSFIEGVADFRTPPELRLARGRTIISFTER